MELTVAEEFLTDLRELHVGTTTADLMRGVSDRYQQTEVGLIPEDWRVVRIGEICALVNGRGFKPHEWGSFGLPIIRIQNLNGSEVFNYYAGEYSEKILVDSGQLLFAWSGSRGTSFGPHVWCGGPALLNYHTWKIVPVKSRIKTLYLFYILRRLTGHIEDKAHGASALVHTQKREMEQFYVALPSIEEQNAIASALSDVDALIASLQEIITKKRAVKAASMQHLVTGNKRLPGFCKEWEPKCLAEIGTFQKGKGIKKDEVVADGLPCIRYGEIYTRHHDYIRQFASFIRPVVARQSQRLRKGDLLFAGSGETVEEIGKCVAFLGEEEAYAGGDIVILSPIGQDPLYLGYLLNHPSIAAQKARMGQGDAVVHISARNLGRLRLRLPPLEEQTAIAMVLSDMDAEIAALEARREKTKAIKQGMMQELLTGRTRLV